jgi:hypothetical protein
VQTTFTEAGAALALLALQACAGPGHHGAEQELSLAHHDDWQLDGADGDPLADHRPNGNTCAEDALRVEATGFEISTEACSYASVSQPIAVAIKQGDRIHFDVWWATLAALEQAEGHLAVVVGDQIVWQDQVAIPGPADVRAVEYPATFDAPALSPITFHVHNHGSNTYKIGDITIVKP